MFLPHVVIEQRKKMGLSQKQLAEGICTQVTISKMENQGIAPTTTLLVKLCDRLHLTLNDLFSQYSNTNHFHTCTVLHEVTEALDTHHYDQARVALDQLTEEEIHEEAKDTFYYLRGTVSLYITHDLTDAQFYFNRVIDRVSFTSKDTSNIPYLMSMSNLGLIYYISHKPKLAKHYFDQVVQLLLKYPKAPVSPGLIRVKTTLAKFYCIAGELKLSQQFIDEALEDIRINNPAPYQQALLYLKAYLLNQTHPTDTQAIMACMKQAQAFANFCDDQSLVEAITYYFTHHEFYDLQESHSTKCLI